MAERARREDVERGDHERRGVGDHGHLRMVLVHPGDRLLVDVGHDDRGAVGEGELGEVAADLADAGDADAEAFE